MFKHLSWSSEPETPLRSPVQLTYTQLLNVFWECHDPTQLNRQGPNIGNQYRSAIFYHSEEQKQEAEKTKAQLEASGLSIVTEIVPVSAFYDAEEYHQMYLHKMGRG